MMRCGFCGHVDEMEEEILIYADLLDADGHPVRESS